MNHTSFEMKKIHFIGIGGVGMSALAKFAQSQGVVVSGSDLSDSEITEDLKKRYEILVAIGTSSEYLPSELDAVVYSPAVPEDNVERVAARQRNIPEYSYPELLGKVIQSHTTIAVSGTNGKTTTTSMIIEIMKDAGYDPSGIVGALLQKYNSNYVAGQSEYFVVEACEYKKSFFHIHHDILVITNITEDHLDYFENLEHIQETFVSFLQNKKGKGILICNTDLPELKVIIKEAEKLGMEIIPYQKYFNESIQLSIPGEHNKQNAAAALGATEYLGIPLNQAKNYLKYHFQGAKRRMEHIGMTEEGAFIFDDYAHNPEGLEYLISGVRDYYPEKKIVMLFEPHLYSRTRDFKEAFGAILSKVDVLYLFPTYRAREPEIPEENFLLEQYVDTKKIKLFLVTDTDTFIREFKNQHYDKNHIIITVGAGSIYKYGKALKKD